jgi:hypothetical protein
VTIMVAEHMFESFPDQGAGNQLVYGGYQFNPGHIV